MKKFGIFYSTLNLFILIMSGITISVYPSNEHVFSCLNECAIPKTNWGATIMFMSRFLQDLGIIMLLYFFWFVPRKYLRQSKDIDMDGIRLS